MKKILFLLLVVYSVSFSQVRVGIEYGFNKFNGDVYSPYNHSTYGLNVSYSLHQYFYVRAAYHKIQQEGNDLESSINSIPYQRGLVFRNNINEFGIGLHFDYLSLLRQKLKFYKFYFLDLYISTGLKYGIGSNSDSFFAIPIGLGAKANITSWIDVEAGWQYNFTGTDQLDGFSQNLTNSRNDYYSLILFSINLNISEIISPTPHRMMHYVTESPKRVHKSGIIQPVVRSMNAEDHNWGHHGHYSKKKYRSSTSSYNPSFNVNASAYQETYNTEEYALIDENEFKKTTDEPLSTFSIDVDNASYTNVRRYINEGQKPPIDAVRSEEFLNYFKYDYPEPVDTVPFSVSFETAPAFWNKDNMILQIGIKGKEIPKQLAKANNIVFLIDVSGSMSSSDKLELIKNSLKHMVNQMSEMDKISIVTYAGYESVALNAANGDDKDSILKVINGLGSGGSTNGHAGIEKAYEIALKNFIDDGNNRVILATDGDFNVGVSSTSDLTRLIEKKKEEGVFLTVVGVGTGNLKDSRMESIADHGNGNYFYLDSEKEGEKVFGDDLLSNIYTIAKDVKIQVEFNPRKVQAYRLIGYENRALENEDFNDDTKDAGELGPGHTVTALYEIIPFKADSDSLPDIDELRYQKTKLKAKSYITGELANVKLRYKDPEENESKLIETQILEASINSLETSKDFKFAVSVVSFSKKLRDSKYVSEIDYQDIIKLLQEGQDGSEEREELLELVKKASKITTE